MAAGAPESGSAAAAAEVATTAAAATAAKLQSEAASGAAIPGDGVETTKKSVVQEVLRVTSNGMRNHRRMYLVSLQIHISFVFLSFLVVEGAHGSL
eukprot:scaffold202698_cov16-Tisochrysis_lutea.AAC.1